MRRFAGSTAAAAVPLLVAAFLWVTARPDPSEEIARLAPVSPLIQAFPDLARQEPPRLWRARLPGAIAKELWAQNRSTWFQVWGEHAGSEPALMLRGGGELDSLPHSIRLGAYRLIAADALSLQSLQQSLAAQPQPDISCEALSSEPPALFWQGEALARLSGSWAPLLTSVRWGCLHLRGDRFWGRVSSTASHLQALVNPPEQAATSVLPDQVLLRLQGRRFAPVLQPLLDAVGWPAVLKPHRRWLLQSPFQLELRRQNTSSPYRASVWLRMWPADQQRRSVAELQRQLEAQKAPQWPISIAGPIRRIERPDGQPQAGWRWFSSGELLIVLGAAVPLNSQPIGAPAAALADGLQLTAAPAALQQLKLLPPALPPLWRKVQQLDARWIPAAEQGKPAQLAGSLTWDTGADSP